MLERQANTQLLQFQEAQVGNETAEELVVPLAKAQHFLLHAFLLENLGCFSMGSPRNLPPESKKMPPKKELSRRLVGEHLYSLSPRRRAVPHVVLILHPLQALSRPFTR